jgi:hypothetical protein
VGVEGRAMKIRVQVVIESEGGEQDRLEEVLYVQRGALCAEDLGLTLAEAKAMLAGVQRTMVTAQAQTFYVAAVVKLFLLPYLACGGDSPFGLSGGRLSLRWVLVASRSVGLPGPERPSIRVGHAGPNTRSRMRSRRL